MSPRSLTERHKCMRETTLPGLRRRISKLARYQGLGTSSRSKFESESCGGWGHEHSATDRICFNCGEQSHLKDWCPRPYLCRSARKRERQ